MIPIVMAHGAFCGGWAFEHFRKPFEAAGFAYPVTLEKVAQWARSLDQRGFQLAPASALTRQ